MKRGKVKDASAEYIRKYIPYTMVYWEYWDYSILGMIRTLYRRGRGRDDRPSYNDVIIMADTETSKKHPNKYRTEKDGTKVAVPVQNHVVAFTVSIRAYHHNLVTLWGRRPSDLADTLDRIQENLPGQRTIVFFHNLSYDWVFIRKFLFKIWGTPMSQLNTKPHYPIYIEFGSGVILRDSLILAQRKLEKWAADLDVTHKKAVGFWDYDRTRSQHEDFTDDELTYIENDTLAGVECIDATMMTLKKDITSLPYTATGIPREQIQKRGKKFSAHERFLSMVPDLEQQKNLERVYHGGYVHANRFMVGDIITEEVRDYDFTSSYPYCMCAFPYPAEKFTPASDSTIEDILNESDIAAFYFLFIGTGAELRDPSFPMPPLQFSKCVKCINPVMDNGRIISADMVAIWLTEQDLYVIDRYMTFEHHVCTHVKTASKKYLPRWFTDYIFECFTKKQHLKGGDPVAYAIAKSIVNCLYGVTVQKPVKDDIQEAYISDEDHLSGDYYAKELSAKEEEDKYNKYVNSYNSVLPYFIGVWVTAYAFRNLFELGECAGTWIYSDTDSVYGYDWDLDAVERYNAKCRRLLTENGYGPVTANGKEYWLGSAVSGEEDIYTEFVALGAKRYAGRKKEDGKIHITVAGVPKNGAAQLQDDLRNFRSGVIFRGTLTGKMQHVYIYVDDIYTDEDGNETGDSIDLNPADYLMDMTKKFELLENEEVYIQVYDESDNGRL